MGGMWPRIYNLTEKSLSARGQMWTLGTSSSFSCLALRWAESHLSTLQGKEWSSSHRKQGGLGLSPTTQAPVLWIFPLTLSHWSPLLSTQLQSAQFPPFQQHSLISHYGAPPCICQAETRPRRPLASQKATLEGKQQHDHERLLCARLWVDILYVLVTEVLPINHDIRAKITPNLQRNDREMTDKTTNLPKVTARIQTRAV